VPVMMMMYILDIITDIFVNELCGLEGNHIVFLIQKMNPLMC
jgi:hypothetical protein